MTRDPVRATTVLWDIDGTLVSPLATLNAPREPAKRAFTSQQIDLAGNTTGGRDAGAGTSDLDFRASTDFAARSRAREA